MENFIYANFDETFFLLDYTPSHSQLVIRSKRNKNRDYNIDILFKPVRNIILRTEIEGVGISLIDLHKHMEASPLLTYYDFVEDKDYKIYTLTDSRGKVFYINAMCFGVYHSKLDILEPIFGRYEMGGFKEENILWHNAK